MRGTPEEACGGASRVFQLEHKGELTMNSLAWIGIIAWGLVLTAFGLVQAAPAGAQTDALAAHDVIFLVGGGLVTCLIGMVGLAGFMGWVPGLRNEQKSRA
jgi:hypothetical protein